ncbi:MAG TPA: cytochrome bc complex cytochrome b subunit [Solirubrobacterales bacterium]|nr:cytochrome bc complex cytochrome b subunit [Solirubrobacterales bacterium]
MIRRAVRALDQRLGASPPLRGALRYVFPDHWTFMLGEIALYCFVVLVGTGIFLTFFYVPSDAVVHYQGGYAPLQGAAMSEAYASVIHISLDVPAGLLIRQTHHWAADVFVVAIVLHLLRILLSGAYRKPRELNYWVGVTLLGLAIFEGFLGYSLVDDLLSGMGLAIAYSVAMSIPVLGGALAFLVWDGEYPGGPTFFARLEILHVLVIPAAIATLIAIHLAQIVRQHHTQFPAEGSERLVRGTPAWPGYALRSIGLFLTVAGVLFLLGGLVQINPIWQWGPYEPYLATNGAQPDWYVGWLIGALRLMPPLSIRLGSYTLNGSPFWGGALFPLVVFGLLYAWPLLMRRLRLDDRRHHNLLQRPRENPKRTALVLAFVGWVFTIFAAGATDRLYFQSFIPYEGQVWVFRAIALFAPFVIYFVTKRVCEELRDREDRPLRGWSGRVIRRDEGTMGFEEVRPRRQER